MKIAITADGNSPEAKVDPRFGRAKFFAICDVDSGAIDFVDNEQNLNAPSGAGVQAAANVVKSGAQVIITGNCGPKAFRTLEEAGVKLIIGAEGGLREAIEKFKRNEYEFAKSSNVEGHW